MNMAEFNQNENHWKSRRVYLMVLLCQTIGTSVFIVLSNEAVRCGAVGYIIGYILNFIIFGIPLVYMEFIVGQFTARDCIDVWKIRPCLSHIGIVSIFWQIVIIIYNHTITSFVVHYFLISFEDPEPYYICGPWSSESCNILKTNYTVNQDCIKEREPANYCIQLFLTFPESQYWRNYILGTNKSYFHIAWRVCLASFLTTIILFFTCFKRKQSVTWFIGVLTVYPMLGYIMLMIGSMLQKGLVVMYEEALDADFTVFSENFSLTSMLHQVISTLNIGTGISFNLAASSSFRSPCYSNIVVIVVVCSCFTVLSVCTAAMMTCPYAYAYGIRPNAIMNYKMAHVVEKTPRLLYEYQYRSLWLVLIFSCNATLGLSTNVILVLNLLEMVVSRYPKLAKYFSLLTFAGTTFIFLITIPLLGNVGLKALLDFHSIVSHINLLNTIIECSTFVLWYGLDKFCEDVHFMQGIQPRTYMKVTWMLSIVVISYIIGNDLYNGKDSQMVSKGRDLGLLTLILLISVIVLGVILKLIVAACRKRFMDVVRLDPTWGPRSEVLKRSRAMFSAQAMTKEYMYRQYHLQAGINERQRRSNIRVQRK